MASKFVSFAEFMHGISVDGHTKIILIPPSMPDLQIMIFYDEVHKFIKEVSTLPCCQAIDVVNVGTNGENALPSSYGIGTHDRVNG
jgi:hypothetical protein